MSFVDLR